MAARSGQTTVATAGTEVALGSVNADGPVMVRALAANTGNVFVGNAGNGTVSSTTGYELSPGDQVVFGYLGSLDTILVDSAVNGDKVCWLILGMSNSLA